MTKSALHTATAVVIGIVVATSASAYSFSPLNTISHLRGRIVITTNGGIARCKAKITVKTEQSGFSRKKAARINAISLSPAGVCTSFGWTGLPWLMTATGSQSGELYNFGFFNGFIGSCSAAVVPFTVDSTGVWTFNGTQSNCMLQGSLSSTPPITIVQ